jgi:AAA family ATP:ADP antiporter
MVKEHEVRAVIFSFLFVVLLMSAYYILRPVRDAMASDWTDAEVSLLWTMNFFISTAIVALYGIMVSKFRFRLLVPTMYGIFAVSFVIFYTLGSISEDRTLIDKAFYVWVSVFSLFNISIFWSFMSELFSKEQSGRLFGIIAVGASVGGLIGPSITAFFSVSLGIDKLMLIASMMLLIPIPIIFHLQSLMVKDLNNEKLDSATINQSIGGNPFAGFKIFFQILIYCRLVYLFFYIPVLVHLFISN